MSENLISLHSPPTHNDVVTPIFGALTVSGSNTDVVLTVEGNSDFYNNVNCCGNIVLDGTLSASGAVTVPELTATTDVNASGINASGTTVLEGPVYLSGLSSTVASASFQLYIANVSLTDNTSASGIVIRYA